MTTPTDVTATPASAQRARVVAALRKQEVLDGVAISKNSRAVFIRIDERRGRQFHVETVRLCLAAEGITAWPASVEEFTLIVSVPATPRVETQAELDAAHVANGVHPDQL